MGRARSASAGDRLEASASEAEKTAMLLCLSASVENGFFPPSSISGDNEVFGALSDEGYAVEGERTELVLDGGEFVDEEFCMEFSVAD